MHDLLIHARWPDGSRVSLAIAEGKVVDPGGPAREEIDAGDALLLPAWIDAHVHFNEPGRTDWEGLSTGSRALAAGGGCAFFDMPLNSSPPVVTAAAFEEKRRLAEKNSVLDFALWGGLTPEAVLHLDAMADAGAIGFKAFMCPSGLDEFPAADPATLKAGMDIAARRRLPVAVHAELPHPVETAGTDMRAWLDSRPVTFETKAIRLALELAGETGCALHVVHVTCPEGIDLITEAKSHGIDVTVETCPHYLLLDRDDALRIGPAAKCAPPLRTTNTVATLWRRLLDGHIDTLGSDHSPAPPDMKTGDDVFAIWGGIAGIQHGLPLLLDRSLDILPQLSSKVADRFRLAGKGRLTPGHDADFILVEAAPHTIHAADLLTRHPISPYLGLTPRHRITATYLRGQRVTSETRGRFLQPLPPSK